MNNIVTWNPIRDIRRMEEMFDRLFEGTVLGRTPNVAALPIDVFERDGKLFVKAAVPGVCPEDLDITVEENVLTIRGETKAEETTEDMKVYRREVAYGTFSRSVRLPENLNFEQIDAEFRNGFVTVSIPYLPEEKPKTVKVNVRNTESPKA
ncbi:MAG: Hsp20/alpha crystallin family protein [Fimbriimonadaceae bacterium]